jgi:L-ribulose-5-phosphate 3-epimerase
MTDRPYKPLAVCSWSLKAGSSTDLAALVVRCGVSGVQLHLDPLRTGEWNAAATAADLTAAGLEIVSGMMAMEGEDYTTLESIARTGGVRPDATWERNLTAAHANAEVARGLGLDLVTFHAGFVPHDADDPERATIVSRTRAVAAAFRDRGVRVALETGQETAANLETFLAEINDGIEPSMRVGVNFDPANMILYGTGEPIDALRRLLPWILQAHMKDARRASRRGEWGQETPAGQGEVNWKDFFRVLRQAPGLRGIVIEREGGEQRVADVQRAAEVARAAGWEAHP